MSSASIDLAPGTAPLVVLEQAAAAMAAAAVPDSPWVAMEQADRLLRVADRVGLAIDERIAVADAAGVAKAAGHAGTAAWLRTGAPGAGRMSASTAARRLRNGRQFSRLPATVAAVREGQLSHPMAAAIASAVAVLDDDEQAGVAERILLRLAADPTATVEKVARAGRYLRQVLDPDGHLGEHERAHRRRYLTAHHEDDGGLSGSYYLPPESAARLGALLDRYARKAAAADSRSQTQRNADVLIQLLAQAVSTELLVLVNAETLPDDSETPADGEARADGESRADGGKPPAGADTAASAPAVPAPAAGVGPAVPDPGACPACGHTANRDVPGLLLSTGHPLPAPDVRRLALTSSLYRAVLAAPSKVLDLGSAVRTAPPWMRRALLATYDTCAYDHCPIPAKWCEIDHIRPWARHRRTRLDDLAPGCDHHNRDRAARPDKYSVGRTRDGRWHLTTIRRYRL